MKLCTPALIYFVLAIVALIIMISNKMSTMFLMGKLVFVVLWTWFLNFVCTNGFTNISWTLVIFPYIVLSMYAIQHKMNEDKKNEPLVVI